MEESILQLSEQCLCPGDGVLVAIARISKLCEDAAMLGYGSDDPYSTGPTSTIVHVKSLQHLLAQIRNDLPPELLSNSM